MDKQLKEPDASRLGMSCPVITQLTSIDQRVTKGCIPRSQRRQPLCPAESSRNVIVEQRD